MTFYSNLVKYIKNFALLIPICIIGLLVVFTLRGLPGNPSPYEIDTKLNGNGQAFETSQERSRYAIILALVNHHRFDLGEYASMGTPDIGKINGKYYSFFPPTASILAIPLYMVGQKLGAAQIFTFSLSTIFSLLTMWMLYKFARSLGLHQSSALFASIAFGFATNAWGYSVTLYAHLLSAFSLIAGIYVVSRKQQTWFNAVIVWLLYAFAIYVDYPNIFAFFPIALVAGLRLFDIKTTKEKLNVGLKVSMIIGPLIFLLFMGAYGYYNYRYFGSPTKFSNTLSRVKDLKNPNAAIPEKGSDSVGALSPRRLINGLYTFTVSHDRGILIYSPVVFLFLFGLVPLKKLDGTTKALLVAVPSVNLVTYSMFGDPWGGWAFGSRYMIAVLPELIAIAALGLEYFARHNNRAFRYGVLVVFSSVFIYSSGMSLMAPLTTNVIPPSVEAGTYALADDYRIPMQMLRLNQMNSFVYNTYFRRKLTGYQYYYAILIPLNIYALALIWWPKRKKSETL